MDLGKLWTAVQETAADIAAKAEETAVAAAKAVEETTAEIASSETASYVSQQFAMLQSDASFTFAELRANTITEANRGERLILLKKEEAERRARIDTTADVDTKLYGVNVDFECFVRDLTERSFLDYPVEDDDAGMDETWTMDEFQRDHTEACMAVVPELATLRFALTRDPSHRLLDKPGEDKTLWPESRFWRTYFRMCGWRLAMAEASFRARQEMKARGIEVEDGDFFPIDDPSRDEMEAMGFKITDEMLDMAADLIAGDIEEIQGEEGEKERERKEKEKEKKAEWIKNRKDWKTGGRGGGRGDSSPGKSGGADASESDGDSVRADSPAPKDESLADSEGSVVLVEAMDKL